MTLARLIRGFRELRIRPLAFTLSIAGSALFSAFFVLAICRHEERPIPRLGELSTSIGIMGFDDESPESDSLKMVVTDVAGVQTRIACMVRGYDQVGTMNCDDRSVRQTFRNRHTTVWWYDKPPYGKMAMQIAIDGKLVFPYSAYEALQARLSHQNAHRAGLDSHCKFLALCLFVALAALFYLVGGRKRYVHP